MTALVFLVRHAAHSELGQKLTGHNASGLTPAGRRQAARLAERLSAEGVACVHSSPCRRARATATAIAQHLGIPLKIASALDEIDFGAWTGCSFEELACDMAWRQWNRVRGASCPPNGETMSAAVERMVAHIERVAAEHAGGQIALVSHCDVIRGAVAHYLGLPVDHMLRFEISPASFTRLHVDGFSAQVLSINERATR